MVAFCFSGGGERCFTAQKTIKEFARKRKNSIWGEVNFDVTLPDSCTLLHFDGFKGRRNYSLDTSQIFFAIG
ncbi:hypothetical protein AO057_03210 [Curvibacter sp. PAE-UM]|nr:hypothetical protein AO057_03210 [Curvibacter sp. PAE-UM]